MVVDAWPGPASGAVAGSLRARSASNSVVYAGSNGQDGLQVFVSDGTPAGTRQVGKIGPWAGSGAVDLGEFVELGGETWFACDDGIYGKEPWRITLTGPVASVFPYGSGCRGSNNLTPIVGAQGLPQLGNGSFGFTLANGAPNAFAMLNVSFTPSNAWITSSCYLLLGQPVITLPGQVTSPTGTALAPLAIPPDPSFAGLGLNGQWLVLDAGGYLFGFGSLSNALSVVMGS
jgi:ELWxxDGT repeat protein